MIRPPVGTAIWWRSPRWSRMSEATQALIELVQWLRVGGRPPDGFTTNEIRALVARLW